MYRVVISSPLSVILEASARHFYARLGRLEVCLAVGPKGSAWAVEIDRSGAAVSFGPLEVAVSVAKAENGQSRPWSCEPRYMG